jgi:hypothetical protein
MRDEVEQLRDQYQFFHWHLAFPDVFQVSNEESGVESWESEDGESLEPGWDGGFDVVLGNPPWERMKFQEKEWFILRAPAIAELPSAKARTNRIKQLKSSNPDLANEYKDALRRAEAENALVRSSGKFYLVSGGDINTYAVFTETAIFIVSPKGRVGLIVPSAITSTLAYQPYISELVESGRLVNYFDFENRKVFFPEVDSRYRFSLLTIRGNESNELATYGFMLRSLTEIREKERIFRLKKSDLSLLSPNTKAFPVFQTQRDALLVRKIYVSTPVLVNEPLCQNPWNIKIYRMIDANESTNLILDDIEIRETGSPIESDYSVQVNGELWLRVYEGKMIDFYNHRFAKSYTEPGGQRSGKASLTLVDQLKNPYYSVGSRYWVKESTVKEKLPNWHKKWLVAFMNVCSSTNIRTMIPSIIPFTGATKSLRLIKQTIQKDELVIALYVNLSSFVFDYVTRQSVSGLNLSEHVVKQLPVLAPDQYSEENLKFIVSRCLELTYTAWDLQTFAQDCGYEGPPFKWDEDRRFLLRCELDAAYFHLYGIQRDDVDYIMETFPIVKRKDEKAHGHYRTKDTILEIYDAMAIAIASGQPYQTLLDPPPADPRVAHPPRESEIGSSE